MLEPGGSPSLHRTGPVPVHLKADLHYFGKGFTAQTNFMLGIRLGNPLCIAHVHAKHVNNREVWGHAPAF